MILSSLLLWLITSAFLAVGLVVLFVRKRRQERAVSEFSKPGHAAHARARAPWAHRARRAAGALGQLGAAVNKLLENLEQRGARLQDREQLFQRLVETVHDAVLVHRKQILFANTRFLSLLGIELPRTSSANR